jgi:uncharacterized membrane protein YfcA
VGIEGDLSQTVIIFVLIGLPAVVLGTWLGRRFQPRLSENNLKRSAFGLLLVIGIWITAGAALRGIV